MTALVGWDSSPVPVNGRDWGPILRCVATTLTIRPITYGSSRREYHFD